MEVAGESGEKGEEGSSILSLDVSKTPFCNISLSLDWAISCSSGGMTRSASATSCHS